jgi:glycerophosphoryl diester phosphodiesterase
MKIIAHRGASGLALENTLEAITAALELKIDAIEFDIRRTKDHKIVVMHDSTTGRIAEKNVNVHNVTLTELQKIRLHNGQAIPTLEKVLKLTHGKKHIVIDIKDSGVSEELQKLLKKYPSSDISFTGLQHSEMKKLFAALPHIPFYVQEHFSPFEVVQTARRTGATGISLNMWLMNPLTYHLAKRSDLKIRLYTVNHPFIMRFMQKLYPGIEVFTNHPHKFVRKHRRNTKRKV